MLDGVMGTASWEERHGNGAHRRSHTAFNITLSSMTPSNMTPSNMTPSFMTPSPLTPSPVTLSRAASTVLRGFLTGRSAAAAARSR